MQSKIPSGVTSSLPRLVPSPSPPSADAPPTLSHKFTPAATLPIPHSRSRARSQAVLAPRPVRPFSSSVSASSSSSLSNQSLFLRRSTKHFASLDEKEEKIPRSTISSLYSASAQMALQKNDTSAASPMVADRPAVFHRGKHSLSVSAYAISKRNVLKCYDSQRVLPHLVSCNLATQGVDTQRFCGEDAFHVSCGTGALTIGIADGVGGWQDQGVDAGLMSHRLMELVREESASTSNLNILPLDLLSRAYDKIKHDHSVLAGSTTACLLSFCLEGAGGGGGSFVPPTPRSEGTATEAPRSVSLPLPAPSLAAVNVGDSGFIIFRPAGAAEQAANSLDSPASSVGSPGKIIFMSEPLQHHGGAPFQLAIIPPHMRHLDAVENEPKDGQQIHVPLSIGDIIILGTDGLLDNLSPPQIENIVNQELSAHRDAPHLVTANICRTLVQRAIAGPKPDDISIIVARLGYSHQSQTMSTPRTIPSSPSPSMMSMNSSSPSISTLSTIVDELSEASIPPSMSELHLGPPSNLPASAASLTHAHSLGHPHPLSRTLPPHSTQDSCLVEVAKMMSQADFEGEKFSMKPLADQLSLFSAKNI